MAVVLITGCSSGIGLEAALAFARQGDRVFASMRNPAKSGRLLERAAAEGLRLEVVALDVTDDASVAAAVAQVEAASGAVDVLVNNAGLGYSGSVESIDLERAKAILDTNLVGAVRCIRAVLPGMRARGSGVIVNVTSVAGRVRGVPYHSFYGVSKHGLNVISEAMDLELDPFGIRIVCIEPGFFSTDIFANSEMTEIPASPYQADHAWVNEFYIKSGEATGGDPAVVSAAIVQAAIDPSTPLHVLVGDDATMFVDLVEQAGTWEGWKPVVVSIVDSVSGPRPVTTRPPVAPG